MGHVTGDSIVASQFILPEGGMTRVGMKEYLDPIRNRYLHGDRQEQSRILNEAVRVTGRHRQALIRALRSQPRWKPGVKWGDPSAPVRRQSLP